MGTSRKTKKKFRYRPGFCCSRAGESDVKLGIRKRVRASKRCGCPYFLQAVHLQLGEGRFKATLKVVNGTHTHGESLCSDPKMRRHDLEIELQNRKYNIKEYDDFVKN